MIGRPERARTSVRIVRRAQPSATRRHALPLTVTIVVITVFVAALFTRATGPRAALIGPSEPPVASTPSQAQDDGGSPTARDASSPGSAGPSSMATSSAMVATSVALVSSTSPTPSMPELPACRFADEPAALAAYDDWQHTIVDTTSRLPKGYVPPDLGRFPGQVCPAAAPFGASRSRISRPSPSRGERPGCDSRSSRATGARLGSTRRSRVGYEAQEKPRPDVSARAQDTRSTSLGPPSISRPRAAGPHGRTPSCARGTGNGWRRMPGASAGSRAIRRARRHGPATALRPGTTALSDGTSPPRSTRRA